MSGGLVASMGMSSQASTRTAPGAEAAAPATAPIAVQPAAAFSSALIAAPGSAQTSSVPLTAPVAATVSFESSDFTAIPKKVVVSAASGELSTGSNVSSSYGSAAGASVLSVASRYIGVPYRYGGLTPSGWDCSGAMQHIYGQIGVKLPRTANQQMLASKAIPRSEAQPGDLVFFSNGGAAYHVAIYAGGNLMYDSGRTGKSFSKREIWTSAVTFGRPPSA
ncbi:C40 family peptidase [Kineosporia babensis]|uniref:C40 family peptidase n=1 Tax=Kineosporia babensis TaxID=499548 RepID=A0A9X1SU42_9ACTN|nr:C40 family peptidase [Kineosporia babensis]MCD5312549.1 C40 family peptidase [Kineosporia babensis]